MTKDEREVIKRAKNLGAVFKKEQSAPHWWYVQGEPYAFETRLAAAHDYLCQHEEIFKSVRQRISETYASNLKMIAATTAETSNQKSNLHA